MTKTKPTLLFSEDETVVQIVFNDGSKSDKYTTKRSALIELLKFEESGKITEKEGDILAQEIIMAEKVKNGIKESDIFEAMMNSLGAFAPVMISLQDAATRPKEPVKVAYFKACERCGKHGSVYTKKSWSTSFYYKKNGLAYIKQLKVDKEIDENEFQKLTREITESTLAD